MYMWHIVADRYFSLLLLDLIALAYGLNKR